MHKLPYFNILIWLTPSRGNIDEMVSFELSDDEFAIQRGFIPSDSDGNNGVSEVSLSFNVNEAIKLRDFLNFALPVDLVKADEL